MLLLHNELFFYAFDRYLLNTMLTSFLYRNLIEAGVDEAGRGCYAGPVFAAAVILPKDFFHPLLNDRKIVFRHTGEITEEDLLAKILDEMTTGYQPNQ